MITLSDGSTIIEKPAENGSTDCTLAAVTHPITVMVPYKYIAVLQLFAAKNDIRYYLNGVNLEVWPTMENGYCDGRLVATDGHRLGMFKLDADNMGIDGQVLHPISIIIPLSMLEQCKSKLPILVTIGEEQHGTKSRQLTLTQANGIAISGLSIDGLFPDYRRVLPTSISGQVSQFNPVYVGELAKAATLLRGKMGKYHVSIGHNGTGAAIVSLNHCDFVGVLMPLSHESETLPAVPAWAIECPGQAAEVDAEELAQAA